MSSFRLARPLLLLLGLILAAGTASAAEVQDARWKDGDFLLRLSDSTAYTIDLAQSDSVQLVIHLQGASLPADAPSREITLRGASGRSAVVAQAAKNEIRLTLLSPRRFGYVTLWRPYSKTLVIHTFDSWTGLDYAQEQYYKGLLAFEQNIEKEGLEFLQVAHATGEPRAASVLGVYYARRGDLNRAAEYVEHPIDADDYAARAEVLRRNGDAPGAEASRKTFDERMADRDPNWASSNTPDAGARTDAPGSGGRMRRPGGMGDYHPDGGGRETMRWLYVGGGALLLILLLLLIVWLARRSRNLKEKSVGERITFPESRQESGRATTVDRKRKDSGPTPPVETRQPEPIPPPPDIYAQHKAKKAARASSATRETPDAPTVSPQAPVEQAPATQPRATAAPIEQPSEEAPSAPTAVREIPAETPPVAVEEAPRTEAPASEPTEPGRARPVPLQAAEIRRRIEAMRSSTVSRPPRPEGNLSEKTTIAEARRLNLSRDTVELRRRMEEANEGR